MKKSLFLTVLVWALVLLLNATGVVINRDVNTVQYLRLQKCVYQADIQNQVAVVTATETFLNLSGTTFNPRLYFPVQEGASPTQLRWKLGGIWYIAQIAGTPSNPQGGPSYLPQNLLDHVGDFPVVFDMNMVVAPQDSLVVELSYVQLLPYTSGNVEMLLLNDYSLIQSQALALQSFEINLISDRVIQSFTAPEVNATITMGDHQASAVYAVENAEASQDYVLQYSVLQDALTLSAMSGIFDPPDQLDDGFFTFIAEPDNSSSVFINKIFTLIIDRSGSMAGDKIVQAKAAAAYITNNLNQGDKFNLIDFNSSVRSCWATHQDYTPANQQVAQAYINALTATGGTNISGAFSTAVPQFANADPSYASIIIFFTDGEATAGITSTPALISHVNSLMDSVQTTIYLFNFGIGQDANRQLLTTLANNNSGVAAFLDNNELQQAITDFYNLIRYPVMLSPSFTVSPPNAISEVYPNPLPNLYQGKQLIVSGRYQTAQPIEITFSGHVYGDYVEYPYSATLSGDPQPGLQFLLKIWAKQKIESLLQQYYMLNENSPEAIALHQLIVDISVAYGVVCEFTSFTGGEVETDDEINIPPVAEVVLMGNYPNPFNPSTTIRFEVKASVRGPALIRIYNSRGQLVKILGLHVNRDGIYEVVWNGTDQDGMPVSSGMYFYTLSLDRYLLSGRMMMVK